jgi:hypothetical protein
MTIAGRPCRLTAVSILNLSVVKNRSRCSSSKGASLQSYGDPIIVVESYENSFANIRTSVVKTDVAGGAYTTWETTH